MKTKLWKYFWIFHALGKFGIAGIMIFTIETTTYPFNFTEKIASCILIMTIVILGYIDYVLFAINNKK